MHSWPQGLRDDYLLHGQPIADRGGGDGGHQTRPHRAAGDFGAAPVRQWHHFFLGQTTGRGRGLRLHLRGKNIGTHPVGAGLRCFSLPNIAATCARGTWAWDHASFPPPGSSILHNDKRFKFGMNLRKAALMLLSLVIYRQMPTKMGMTPMMLPSICDSPTCTAERSWFTIIIPPANPGYAYAIQLGEV